MSHDLADTAARTKPSRQDGPAERRRGRNVALWAVQVVTAAAFALAAAMKLTGTPEAVATFDTIGFGDWFRHGVAVLELVGAVAVLVPRLAGLAGLAFVGLMGGALVTHLVVIGDGAVNTLPFLLLSALVAWGRRQSTAALVADVRFGTGSGAR